ncbi:hypothetical protein [Arthrobacter caoxuetaonis]|uniref:Uncharacterized protein n=1 Tax=Arthrobacter caoxuetaonis TaxID=2886935 RepID=A0A9X1MG41_9MICC|nr:hypothetical protein [Arthrobacter caoxuetaonis]MCC3299423.1 hypothetical protein [Arthrobacter caoxuetaonis]USQ59084.1 hypothetical protein NF551_18435 [Arthrobacter caoxuetaonis]
MAALILTEETRSRSIQVRGPVTDSTPVQAKLPPFSPFVPADMLLSWILYDGDVPRQGNSFTAYLWPAERKATVFGHWQSHGDAAYPPGMPAWVAAAADELRSAFVQGTELPAGEISLGTGLNRRFRVEGSPLTPFRSGLFIPAELSVSWIASESDTQQRYRMAARPDRLTRGVDAQHWVGTFDGGYEIDTPEWVIKASEQCRADLPSPRP